MTGGRKKRAGVPFTQALVDSLADSEGGSLLGPARSILDGIRQTFDCSGACFYVIRGGSLRLEHSSFSPQESAPAEIALDSDHPAAVCARTGRDFPDGKRKKDWEEGTIFAFPVARKRATFGVLLLSSPRREKDSIRPLSSILKRSLPALFVDAGARNNGDPVAGDEWDMLITAFRGISSADHPSGDLEKLTDTLHRACRLRSLQLYREKESGIEVVLAAGEKMRIDTLNEIHESMRSGRETAVVRHDPAGGPLLTRVTLPVGHGRKCSLAAVYEIDAGRDDAERVRDIVSAVYNVAIGQSESEITVSLDWLKAIELMESAANEVSGLSGSSSLHLLERVLERLRETGFITDFALLSGEELKSGSMHVEGKAKDPERERRVHSLLRAAAESMRPVFDSETGSMLSFPVQSDDGRTWSVLLVIRRNPLFRAEKELWEHLALCFGILFRAFISRAKGRKQSEKIKELKAGASAFLELSRTVGKADSPEKLITRCAEGMTNITRTMTYGFIREGGIFSQISPRDEGRAMTQEDVTEMMSSSLELGRHVHILPIESVSSRLADLAGGEAGKRLCLLTVGSGKGNLRGALVCPGLVNDFITETMEVALAGLAQLANIKMEELGYGEKAALETKKLARIEAVMSMISMSEREEAIMSSIVDAASELTNSEMAELSILDVEKNEVVMAKTTGFVISSDAMNVSSTNGVSGRILRTQEPEIVNDYPHDPDRDEGFISALNFRQMAGVPIRIDVKHRGVLMAANSRDGAYSTDHLRTLAMLADIASSAARVTNARSERRRLMTDFNSLQSAEMKLYSSRTFGELIPLLAEEVRKLFHASTVLISADVNGVKRIMFSTSGEIREGDVVYNSSPIGTQFDRPPYEARIVERASMEEGWARNLETNELLLVRAGTQYDSIVITAVNSVDAPDFSVSDIDNFSKLSKIASAAVDKTKVLGETNQKLKHLEITHAIVDGLVYGKKEYEIFDTVLPTLVSMCGADVGLLWRYDEEKEKASVSAEHYTRAKEEHLVGYETNPKRGIVGSVVRNRMPVLVANAALDNLAVQITGTNVERFESVIGLPLIVRNRLVGILTVYRDEPPPFTYSELDTLSSVANDISLVMAKHSIEREGTGSDRESGN